MTIDKTLRLPSKNFIETPTPKSQIILGNTLVSPIKTYNKWIHRYNGNYLHTAQYTISNNGIIYEHFEPEYTSKYFLTDDQNRKSIIILLENDGWLNYDENGNSVNQFGYIYKGSITSIKWRNKEHWANYTKEQSISTLKLLNYLCLEFSICRNIVDSNIILEDTNNFKGVLYSSNLNTKYTDLSPSWDFTNFKKNFDENEI